MIKFEKPENLNGAELIDELLAAGIEVADSDIPDRHRNKKPPFDGQDGFIYLDISEENKDKAAAVVAAHNGTTVAPEPTIEDKLASVGLSLDELRVALGGN